MPAYTYTHSRINAYTYILASKHTHALKHTSIHIYTIIAYMHRIYNNAYRL